MGEFQEYQQHGNWHFELRGLLILVTSSEHGLVVRAVKCTIFFSPSNRIKALVNKSCVLRSRNLWQGTFWPTWTSVAT